MPEGPPAGSRGAWAPYMEWAKGHPPATHDLTVSTLLACTVGDLPGALDAVELDGPNENGYSPLVEAIASRYATTPDRVATASGTSGANFLTFAALLRPGDEVVVERPGYDPLLGAPHLLGAVVRRFDRRFEEGYVLDPDRVASALSSRTRLIVLSNPHNPSGVLASPDSLDAVARLAEANGARVLVDEVYLDASWGAAIGPVANRNDTFISTSSLTKAYGLGGLRCGWAIAPPEVAEAMRRVRDVVDAVGAFAAERIAALAFEHLDRLAARARGILKPNFDRLRAFVEDRSELEWVRPSAGTVGFPRIRGLSDSLRFVERLRLDHGTGVVPGSFFQAPAHFRIAYGGAGEVLASGLAALARALDDRAGGGPGLPRRSS